MSKIAKFGHSDVYYLCYLLSGIFKGHTYDISNKHRLGYSEVQLVQTMIDGVNTLWKVLSAVCLLFWPKFQLFVYFFRRISNCKRSTECKKIHTYLCKY